MPFGLKNAGATYQRAMTALFHDMIHKEIVNSVDDMIAKSWAEEDHLVNLKKVFDRLQKYSVFVFIRKSLCLVLRQVSYSGSLSAEEESKSTCTKAIIDMPVPKTEKEIRVGQATIHQQVHCPAHTHL